MPQFYVQRWCRLFSKPQDFKYGCRCLLRAIMPWIHCGAGTANGVQVQCNCRSAQLSRCLPKDERYYAWGGEAEPSHLHFCRIVLNVTVSWSGERFSSQYAKICFKGWFISLYTVLKTTYIIHLITYIDCMTTGIICRAQYNENGRYSLI